MALGERRAVAWATGSYGDAFTVRLPGAGDVVVVTDPGLARAVFRAPPGTLAPQEHLGEIYGETSVLLAEGSEHRELRRRIAPALRSPRLEHHAEAVAATVERAVERCPRSRPVALLPELRRVALEVILLILFGSEAHRSPSWRRTFTALLTMVTSGQMVVRFMARDGKGVRRWRRFQRARAACHQLVDEEIARRRASAPSEDPDEPDVLALLLGAGCPHGDGWATNVLRDQLMTLAIGGYDAPAISVAWTLERLARHPEALERVVEEAHDGSESPYTEAAIRETLRVRPSVSLVARRVARPFELAGHLLAPGTLVMPYLLSIHTREDAYADPTAFRPERFLTPDPPGNAWLPFGGGAHGCLGTSLTFFELPLIVHALLRRVTLSAPRRGDEPIKREAATFVPGWGCRMVVAPR